MRPNDASSSAAPAAAGGPSPTLAAVLPLRPPDPCLGMQSIFFAGDQSSIEFAKDICAGCPRQAGCLTEALAWPKTYYDGTGVWGGTSPADRRIIRARRQGAA